MNAHPNANRPLAERLLPLARGGQSLRGPREGDEEGIALGVDLDPPVAHERLAQHAAVVGEEVGVGGAELVQETSRALDVGEEERDGAGREITHARECDLP